jgi:uridylate kinase
MTQLIVELGNKEMAQLRAAAIARRIDPGHMTSQQLIEVLNAADATAKKKLWRVSVRARRNTNKSLSAVTSLRNMRNTLKLRSEREQSVASVASDAPALADAARAQRLAAIMSVNGMWKDDPDKPRDAVEYQREIRAEWR